MRSTSGLLNVQLDMDNKNGRHSKVWAISIFRLFGCFSAAPETEGESALTPRLFFVLFHFRWAWYVHPLLFARVPASNAHPYGTTWKEGLGQVFCLILRTVTAKPLGVPERDDDLRQKSDTEGLTAEWTKSIPGRPHIKPRFWKRTIP
jgi:hypothetical protein